MDVAPRAFLVFFQDLHHGGISQHRPVHEKKHITVKVDVALVHGIQRVYGVNLANSISKLPHPDHVRLLCLDERRVKAVQVRAQHMEKGDLQGVCIAPACAALNTAQASCTFVGNCS